MTTLPATGSPAGNSPVGALTRLTELRAEIAETERAFPGAGLEEEALASARAAMAAALAAGAPYLLLSSCTVYGRPRNLPCEEGDPKRPIDQHGLTRWAVEREAFLWRRTRGLKLIVLRPALTYGPRQRRGLAAALVVASLAAHGGRSLWLPRRGPVVHLVHAEDGVVFSGNTKAECTPDDRTGRSGEIRSLTANPQGWYPHLRFTQRVELLQTFERVWMPA